MAERKRGVVRAEELTSVQGKTSLCWVLVSDKPELSKANVTDGASANREKESSLQ